MRAPVNTTRCIAIVGPSQVGKTTLMESLLHVCGQIHQKGSVENNNTLSNSAEGLDLQNNII